MNETEAANEYMPSDKWDLICWGSAGCGYRGNQQEFWHRHQIPWKCPKCGKTSTFKAEKAD